MTRLNNSVSRLDLNQSGHTPSLMPRTHASTALIKIYEQPLKKRQLRFFGARRAGRYNSKV
jgi:hypothetical protein